MFINLCFNSDKVIEIIKESPDEKVLDFTGVLYLKKIQNPIIFARQIDADHELEEKALDSFVEIVGKLSLARFSEKKHIRNIKLFNLNIWWQTLLSEKHDSYHWAQITFFFFHFLKAYNEYFEKDCKIILHTKNHWAKDTILLNIDTANFDNISFIHTEHKKSLFKTLIYNLLKEFLYFTLFHLKTSFNKKKSLHLNRTVFFITPNDDAVINNSDHFDIGWQKKYLTVNHQKTINLPYLKSFKNIPKLNDPNINSFYISSFPRGLTVLRFLSSIFFGFINLNFLAKNDISVDHFKFASSTIKQEFKEAFLNTSPLINYLILRRLSNKTVDCKYYYSDELYVSGRSISKAINKKNNNRTIGVQHGLIPKNHTVYRITDYEQTGIDDIPLPDELIIWDSIFKTVLSLNSKKITERINLINNRQYFDLKKRIQSAKKDIINKKITLLWCTTIPEHFCFEAKILEQIDTEKYNILIRLHPAKYILPEFVKTRLKNRIKYTLSNNNLESDFIIADYVITNPFSTIIYDAINVGVPVIRILNFSTYIDFKGIFPDKLFDINNCNQLIEILNN